MKITPSILVRMAGLSAVIGGSLFIGIQAVHPSEILSSITTDTWATIHILGVAMCIFNLIAITGIYARQVERAGWLGFTGYVLFSLMWVLTMAFQFAEAFITPQLVAETPRYVEGFLGITSNAASEVSLGALPTVYAVTSALYLFGGALFGVATLRAGILPRAAAGLLALGTVATLAFAFVPHEFVRLAAVPVGAALMWLGFALLLERREPAAAPVPAQGQLTTV